jgi:hypothetical protein
MFKEGDKVECIDVEDADRHLIKGEIYTIKEDCGATVRIENDPAEIFWIATRFRLAKETKVSKFKVGDKVKCIDVGDGYDNSTFLFLNNQYDVTYVDDRNDKFSLIMVKDKNGHRSTLWVKRFELVKEAETPKDELQTLIDDANKGLIALAELKLRASEVKAFCYANSEYEVPTVLTNTTFIGLLSVYRDGTWTLVKKPKGKLQAIKIAGYDVTQVASGDLKFGCQVHSLDKIKRTLKTVLYGAGQIPADCSEYAAVRKGIMHGSTLVTWEEAEKLYAAVEFLT